MSSTNHITLRPPYELGRSYIGGMLDITGARDVEISQSRNMSGFVLHVNVDGMCVLRICRIKGQIIVEDLK